MLRPAGELQKRPPGPWGPAESAAALSCPGPSPTPAPHPLSQGLAFVFQTLSATSAFRILAKQEAPFGVCFYMSCLPLAGTVAGPSCVGTGLQLSVWPCVVAPALAHCDLGAPLQGCFSSQKGDQGGGRARNETCSVGFRATHG